MGAKRNAWAMISMAMGLGVIAGCAAEPFSAPKSAGPYNAPTPAAEPPAPPPAATYAPADMDAPRAPQASPSTSRASRDEGWRRRDTAKEERESPRQDRPGLGTEWGESRHSSITRVSFERADFGAPFASLALFYNDQAGANAVSGAARSWANQFSVAGGLVSVDLRDESGRPFSGFISGGRSTVIGEAGHRYSIVLKNRTDHRFEVVLSVDGLDVMDGKAASFGKRGYILDAHGELEVDGFRQSTDTVAAFRFGAVKNSYAEKKHGDSRNVGVIGVALFHERGDDQPVWTAEEVNRRRNANPFPGTFATPPGE